MSTPRFAVLNVVGLTARLIGPEMPKVAAFLKKQAMAQVRPAFPAVTCTAQATYLTGLLPGQHGCVANGWYERVYAEPRFWKQPESLMQGSKIWERLRERHPGFTCAKLFWWYNMHSSADYTVTPRPLYPSDGRKVFDIHTQPMDMREQLKAALGDFPFPAFWGPGAGIASSRWIAASARWVEERHQPNLSLVYLPHLDYDLQRYGLDFTRIKPALHELDDLLAELLHFYEQCGVGVVLLSEYGITDVQRPVNLNRLFRQHGWLSIKNELGLETLDYGGCRALALADHQVAHVYVPEPALRMEVRAVLEQTPGVEAVLDTAEQSALGLAHARSGDFLVQATADSWFTYYHWLDDSLAPDYARCVDIHRKCGYDPVELFLDPALRWPKLQVGLRLLKKKLGLRYLMDVIPLQPELVRGSHGRIPEDSADWPLLIGPFEGLPSQLVATDVQARLMSLFG
jgi:predicted AlkP superfamily pyrophosphatase or phosphodiesterase